MSMNGAFAAILVLGVLCATKAHGAESWTIVVGDPLAEDEAVKVAIEDLQEAGAGCGLQFTVADDSEWPNEDVLVVGAPSRNAQTARLVNDGALELERVDDAQGYTVRTVTRDGRRIVAVAGGSVIGEVYGLYWVRDRIRVHRRLPDINVTRIPALKVRVGAAWGRHGHGGSNREQMQAALRHTSNWVAGANVLDLVPWDADPERAINAENREKTRALIAYAHSLHMK